MLNSYISNTITLITVYKGGIVMKEKDKKLKLVQSASIIAACAVVLIIAAIAWFANNRQVSGTGMGVTARGQASLKISKTEDGDDIDELTGDDKRIAIDYTTSADKPLSPGCSGSFDLYVTSSSQEDSTSFKIRTDITVKDKPVVIGEDNSEKTGYRTDITDESLQTAACNYANGHILIFRNKSVVNGKVTYSGLVPASFMDDTDSITNPNGISQHYTFYWIWVYSYSDISGENSTGTENSCIAKADRDIIKTYIEAEKTAFKTSGDTSEKHYFDPRGVEITSSTKLSGFNHYFDYADVDIGKCIAYIDIGLEFYDVE